MKLYLNLLFIFCFTIFSAQNKEPDSSAQKMTIKTNTVLGIENEKSQSSLLSENKDDKLTSEMKIKNSNYKKSIAKETLAEQNINIVQEINAVLNYKVNRVWRRDLYCLVCEKNHDSGKAA